MSYVYIRSEPGCYTVGFYQPNGKWNPESDHHSSNEAAARVAYLNGGAELANARQAMLAVDGLLAQAGYTEDSSARHLLACARPSDQLSGDA